MGWRFSVGWGLLLCTIKTKLLCLGDSTPTLNRLDLGISFLGFYLLGDYLMLLHIIITGYTGQVPECVLS